MYKILNHYFVHCMLNVDIWRLELFVLFFTVMSKMHQKIYLVNLAAFAFVLELWRVLQLTVLHPESRGIRVGRNGEKNKRTMVFVCVSQSVGFVLTHACVPQRWSKSSFMHPKRRAAGRRMVTIPTRHRGPYLSQRPQTCPLAKQHV